MSRLLFESRAAVLACEAQQALIEKEIELEKLKQQRKPLTDEQIDRAIAELGLNYFADAANNRAVLRELCRKAAHGIKKGNT